MATQGRGYASPESLSNYTDHIAPVASLHVEPLREGAAGTFQSLAAMRSAVLGQIPPDYSGYSDSFNKQEAMRIVGSPQRSLAPEKLFQFVRDEISYLAHPWNLQVVQDCKRTLESRQGDCVSKSVCLATLLACWGFLSRFVAQAPDDAGFSHVYLEYVNPETSQWVALDPTADGKGGRPYFYPGDFQRLPDGGCETTFEIF